MHCEEKKRTPVKCKRDPQGSKKWNIYKNYNVYSSLKPEKKKEPQVHSLEDPFKNIIK